MRQRRFQANVNSRGGQHGARDKRERQDRFVALVAGGMTRREAEATVGVRTNTVDQWIKRDVDFKLRYNLAKQKAAGEWQADKVPFDAAFRKRFFHHDTPPHLARLMEVINEQVAIAAEEGSRDRRILILLPPEHAKSTLLEEYLAYRISQDETFRSSMVCATQGQGRKRLGAIARMLTDRNEYADLIDTYGPFRSEDRSDGKPWTADYFTHLRAPAAQRDYTCQALGWTGSIYGDRMDLIVCDDIADLKNQTPSEIDKQWEKLWGEFRSRIRKGGLFVVIGTHMREGDIYTVTEDKGFFTEVIKMPAITREPGTLGDDDEGECLWPDNVSMRELLKIRETDLRMFELMYQQNPLPNVGAIFPLDAIENCYDDTRKIGDIPEGAIVVAGVDPSVNNWTAGVVVALKQTQSGEWARYLVDVWREKNLTGDGGDNHIGVVDFIVEICRTYRVTTLCVEDGAWMSLINNAFTLRSKLYDLGVRHIPVKATETTVGAEAIRQLSGLFTHRLISLPGTKGAKQQLAVFVNELLTWTGEKSHWRKSFDTVKAFRQCEHAVQFTTHAHRGNLKAVAGPDTPDWMVA